MSDVYHARVRDGLNEWLEMRDKAGSPVPAVWTKQPKDFEEEAFLPSQIMTESISHHGPL